MASPENAANQIDQPFAVRPHILVVDDDERICKLLARYLLDRGFVVLTAHNAEQALDIMKDADLDLAVLDIMMPGQSGLELAKDVKKLYPKLPFIFLTALGDAQERITGLEAGADDYVPKPFDPQELFLRIQALLKRTMIPREETRILQLGAMSLDLGQGILTDEQGQPIDLTDAERELLLVLGRQNGQTLSRETLAQECGAPSDRAIDVQMTRLRRKIETDSQAPRFLQTVRGKGYVLRSLTKESA